MACKVLEKGALFPGTQSTDIDLKLFLTGTRHFQPLQTACQDNASAPRSAVLISFVARYRCVCLIY